MKHLPLARKVRLAESGFSWISYAAFAVAGCTPVPGLDPDWLAVSSAALAFSLAFAFWDWRIQRAEHAAWRRELAAHWKR